MMNKIMFSIALFGAPAAWVTQMMLSEPAVDLVCAKDKMYGLLPAISISCISAVAASTFIAWRFWRESRNGGGNMRFMALVSLLSSGLFMVVTIFTTCSILLVSPCYAGY